jgi:hypothetical protein
MQYNLAPGAGTGDNEIRLIKNETGVSEKFLNQYGEPSNNL